MKTIYSLSTILISAILCGAQTFPYSGKVIDNSSSPIQGATIELSGTSTFTETDTMGCYGDYTETAILEPSSLEKSNPFSFNGNILQYNAETSNESLTADILDLKGRQLYSKKFNTLKTGINNLPITTSIAKGIYILRIISQKKTYQLKVCLNNENHDSKSQKKIDYTTKKRAAGDSIIICKHGYLPDTIEASTKIVTTTLAESGHSSCGITYQQEKGNSWHFVGQDQWVNTYRGIQWVGESKSICRVDMHLNHVGDISNYNYKVTVWEIDLNNDLELTTLLATSDTVSGSLVESGGSWVRFNFNEPVTLISGKTAVLISRDDITQYDYSNIIQISNNYDENDEENDQFNVHYSETTLAGRRPGDEDQPEPFAFDIRLYGEKKKIDSSLEAPAQPMNISAVDNGNSSATISWDDFNVAVDVEEYRVYSYELSNAALTLIGTSKTKSLIIPVESAGTELNVVVTSVSTDGVESYHTDIASVTVQ